MQANGTTLFHIWKHVEAKFYKFSLETGEGRVELFSISGFRGYLLLLCGENLTERKNSKLNIFSCFYKVKFLGNEKKTR